MQPAGAPTGPAGQKCQGLSHGRPSRSRATASSKAIIVAPMAAIQAGGWADGSCGGFRRDGQGDRGGLIGGCRRCLRGSRGVGWPGEPSGSVVGGAPGRSAVIAGRVRPGGRSGCAGGDPVIAFTPAPDTPERGTQRFRR